jgi:hypothetical protein
LAAPYVAMALCGENGRSVTPRRSLRQKLRPVGRDVPGRKQFMLRGDVLDLAVTVVMGAAFGGVVTALVSARSSHIWQTRFFWYRIYVNGSKLLNKPKKSENEEARSFAFEGSNELPPASFFRLLRC